MLCAAPASFAQPVDCTFVPSNRAEISFAGSGIVAEMLVDRGQSVRAGQLVGRLESSVEETTLAIADLRSKQDTPIRNAEAKLKLAEANLARVKALFRKGTVPQGSLDQAQAERDAAAIDVESQKDQASLDLLEAQRAHRLLERRNLRSPFDGVVIDRYISPGEYADAQHVLGIAQLDPLAVEINLPAAAFGSLKVGDTLSVIPASGGAAATATIATVDPMIDANGGFRVRGLLANPGNTMPAGSRCTVDVAGQPSKKP